jgi:hypothetical protein
LLITQKHYVPKRKTIFWNRIQEYLNGVQAELLRNKSRIELDEMIATNNSQSLNTKLGLYFAYSNSQLLHHFFIDRNGLLIFQFLKMTFLLTRGDFASAFLDSIYYEIGFKRPRQTMNHQIMMCLEQAIASSIKKNVEDPYAEEFQDFYEENKKEIDDQTPTKIKSEITRENSNIKIQEASLKEIDSKIKAEGTPLKEGQIKEEKQNDQKRESKSNHIFGDAFKTRFPKTQKIEEEGDLEKFLLCDDLGIRFYEKQHGFIQQFVNFSLYLPEFEFPLNNVFSKSMLRKYSLIFQYLFSLKTIQYRLRQYWLQNSKVIKLRHNPRLSRLLLLLHAFQGKLRSFFDGLLDYYMVDVVMNCWEEFRKQLKEVLDFEELIKMHQRFVFNILEKLALDFDNEVTKKRRTRLRTALAQIFRNFQEYVQIQQFVFKNLVNSGGREGDEDSFIGEDERLQTEFNQDNIIKESFGHLFKIEKIFSGAVLEFTGCLKEKEFEMRNDFNEYYARDTRTFG